MKEHMEAIEEFNRRKKLCVYFDSRAAKAIRGEKFYGQ